MVICGQIKIISKFNFKMIRFFKMFENAGEIYFYTLYMQVFVN